MFKRRNKRSIIDHMREWVWPRAGWRRLAIYYRHRLARMPDTPYRVAAGVACGAAVSFTPFLGLHVGLALVVAFVMRANLLAAAIGTIIGNPWTFIPIWALTYWVGARILGMDSSVAVTDLIDMSQIFVSPFATLKPVLPPLIAGGIPIAVMVWFAVYWPTFRLIHRYRRRRLLGLERRMKREQMVDRDENSRGES